MKWECENGKIDANNGHVMQIKACEMTGLQIWTYYYNFSLGLLIHGHGAATAAR